MRVADASSWWPLRLYINNPWAFFTASPLVVELVKTGRITAGGTMTGELAGSWAQDKTFQFRSIRISGSIELKPTVPTCSVTTKSIKVQFGEVNLNSTAMAPEQPVNIGLQCSGGTRDAKTRMYITLTDATNPGNRSDVLTLTNASTAKGVGIRIMNGTTPVRYGPDSSEAGNPNQWFVTEAGNQTVNIPLSARYVRTSDTLKAGTADAVATFTMSYQ
ncbi:type 1 fimbrial protein [Burkholderia diffusa]|nr:type 1 fimbrial protein [Burkholderia diffusa]